MKALLCLALAAFAANTTAEPAQPSAPDAAAVTWLPAPAFAPPADCDGEGICHNPNTSCKALENEYCNSSLPAFPSGCKDPDMAGRTHKTDHNGDCCWCLYNG